jgi:membrane protease YdiL (CAAX protease family)
VFLEIIVWGIIVFFGIRCAAKAHFRIVATLPLRALFLPSIAGGILAGGALTLLDTFIFTRPITGVQIQWVQGLLASFYGAINEEVFVRLFLLSLYVWILQSMLPKCKRDHIIWSGILFTSLIFGIGHLPALHKLVGFSVEGVTRVIMLNGIAGIIFGYLYWRYGLISSMLAHFIADLILHVLLL